MRSVAQSITINEIVAGVTKMQSAHSGQAKSILEDLGTIQEAAKAANQLMSQKAELDNRIGARGKHAIKDFIFLQVCFCMCQNASRIEPNTFYSVISRDREMVFISFK